MKAPQKTENSQVLVAHDCILAAQKAEIKRIAV
jgi:hypothetical protein